MAFVWVLQISFYRIFLTSSASEASAPCDPDRTEVGIVAVAEHYVTRCLYVSEKEKLNNSQLGP